MPNRMNSQRVTKYYDKRGEDYSRAWASIAKKRLSEKESSLIRKELESIQKTKGSNKIKTLDIGIGTGRISEEILKYQVEHWGTDISQTMVNLCKNKFNKPRYNGKIKQFIVHDINNPLSEEWGKFDLVTAMRVLDYTKSWEEEIRNIFNAMNPGGILIFTFANKYSTLILPRLMWKKTYLGDGTSSKKELESAIQRIGFSKCEITGFSRLMDVFYDWCNNNMSAGILFSIEKFLETIFGKTLFARVLYVICKK